MCVMQINAILLAHFHTESNGITCVYGLGRNFKQLGRKIDRQTEIQLTNACIFYIFQIPGLSYIHIQSVMNLYYRIFTALYRLRHTVLQVLMPSCRFRHCRVIQRATDQITAAGPDKTFCLTVFHIFYQGFETQFRDYRLTLRSVSSTHPALVLLGVTTEHTVTPNSLAFTQAQRTV